MILDYYNHEMDLCALELPMKESDLILRSQKLSNLYAIAISPWSPSFDDFRVTIKKTRERILEEPAEFILKPVIVEGLETGAKSEPFDYGDMEIWQKRSRVNLNLNQLWNKSEIKKEPHLKK